MKHAPAVYNRGIEISLSSTAPAGQPGCCIIRVKRASRLSIPSLAMWTMSYTGHNRRGLRRNEVAAGRR